MGDESKTPPVLPVKPAQTGSFPENTTPENQPLTPAERAAAMRKGLVQTGERMRAAREAAAKSAELAKENAEIAARAAQSVSLAPGLEGSDDRLWALPGRGADKSDEPFIRPDANRPLRSNVDPYARLLGDAIGTAESELNSRRSDRAMKSGLPFGGPTEKIDPSARALGREMVKGYVLLTRGQHPIYDKLFSSIPPEQQRAVAYELLKNGHGSYHAAVDFYRAIWEGKPSEVAVILEKQKVPKYLRKWPIEMAIRNSGSQVGVASVSRRNPGLPRSVSAVPTTPASPEALTPIGVASQQFTNYLQELDKRTDGGSNQEALAAARLKWIEAAGRLSGEEFNKLYARAVGDAVIDLRSPDLGKMRDRIGTIDGIFQGVPGKDLEVSLSTKIGNELKSKSSRVDSTHADGSNNGSTIATVSQDNGNGGNKGGGTSARRHGGAGEGRPYTGGGQAAPVLEPEVGRVEIAKDEPRPVKRKELTKRNTGVRKDLRERRDRGDIHARRENPHRAEARGGRPSGFGMQAANDNAYAEAGGSKSVDTNGGIKVIPIRSEGSSPNKTSSGQTVGGSNSQNVVVNNTTQSVPSTQVGTAQTGTNRQSTGTTQTGTTANGQTVIASNTPSGTGTGSTATQGGTNTQPTANSQTPTNTQVGTSTQGEPKPSGNTEVGQIKINVKKAQGAVAKGTDGSVIRVKEGDVVVEKKEGFWAKNNRRDRGLGVVVGGVFQGMKIMGGGAIGIHRKADGSRYTVKEVVVEGGRMVLQGTAVGGAVDVVTNVVGRGGAFLAEQGARGLGRLAAYGASGVGRAAQILSKAAPTLVKVAPAVGGTAQHIPGIVGNSVGVVMSAREGIVKALDDYEAHKVGKTITVARIGVTGGAAVSSVLIGGYTGGVAATATVFIVGGTAATGGVLLPVVAAVVVGGVVTYVVYKGVRGIGEGAIHLAGKIADSETFKTLVGSLDKKVVQELRKTGRTLVESLDKNLVQVVGRTVVDLLTKGAKAGIEGVKAGYKATTQALGKGAAAVAEGVRGGYDVAAKAVNDMKDKAKTAVNEAKAVVNEGVDKAKVAASEAMNSAKARLSSATGTLRGLFS